MSDSKEDLLNALVKYSETLLHDADILKDIVNRVKEGRAEPDKITTWLKEIEEDIFFIKHYARQL